MHPQVTLPSVISDVFYYTINLTLHRYCDVPHPVWITEDSTPTRWNQADTSTVRERHQDFPPATSLRQITMSLVIELTHSAIVLFPFIVIIGPTC